MSFFSDLTHGNFSNLGSDITHAPESLAKHPSQLWETAGGIAALATGGLALGAEAGLAGAGAAGVAGADVGTAGVDLAGLSTVGGAAGADAALPGVSSAVSFAGDATAAGGGDVALGGAGQAAGGDTLALTDSASTSAPSAAGTGNTWSNFVQDPIGSLGKAAAPTPLQLASAGAGAVGLGYNYLQGKKTDANIAAMQQQAANQAAQGQQLQSYLQSGQLPPGLAAQMQQAVAANKARITSNYAAQGQSTDPAKNSALAQDLNTVDMQAQAMQGQIATQLLSSGQAAVGMSSQLYESLAQIDMTQAQNTGKAIANFAASLSGRTGVPVGGGQSVTVQPTV